MPSPLSVAIISGIRRLREKVSYLTSENNDQKARIRGLETEVSHQRTLYNIEVEKAKEIESRNIRRSLQDSGFGSIEDSDEALERLKESHAKERMSRPLQLKR